MDSWSRRLVVVDRIVTRAAEEHKIGHHGCTSGTTWNDMMHVSAFADRDFAVLALSPVALDNGFTRFLIHNPHLNVSIATRGRFFHYEGSIPAILP
jgi:hypothetical protein